VLFSFQRDGLTLSSRAKESGQSKVAIPVVCNGTAEFILDVNFMRGYLRVLDANTVVNLFISPNNDPVLLETDDGDYRYLVMPMAKPDVETAKPDADTGVEVVGQVSTEEESMNDADEFPCPDDDTDLQKRFFQLQMKNDQLQAKAEHYRTLLDRAMRVIAKMKAEQRVCV
jgi:hypothetical protein